MSDKTEILNAVPEMKCGLCGATGCRLYRPAGEFRREHRDRCNGCVTAEQRGFYVPLVVDSDGRAWGFSSVPDADCARFYALPEATRRKSAYTWELTGWRQIHGDKITSIYGNYLEGDKIEVTTSGEFNTPQERDQHG